MMLYVDLYQLRLMALSELRLMFGAISIITPLIYVSGDGKPVWDIEERKGRRVCRKFHASV